MQSTRTHTEFVTLASLDAVIEWVRDQARRNVRYGSRLTAADLRALNEFLLRPTRELVAQLASVGSSAVEPTPAEEAEAVYGDDPKPPRNFRLCGKCNRTTRHGVDDDRCRVCGSAKPSPTSEKGVA